MKTDRVGSYDAHMVAGVAFLTVGVWWLIQMYVRYHVSLINGAPFRSTCSYTCRFPGCRKEFPIEALAKIVITIIGICVENAEGYLSHGAVSTDTGLHFTMYAFFGMSGVIDILLYFGFSLPPGVEYVALFLAFAVEGFTFSLHTSGRTDLNVFVHALVKYIVAATVLVIVAEMRFRDVFLVSLSRAYLTILQGTWFCHLAFILYNPIPSAKPWNEYDHESISLAATYFHWHAAAVFASSLAVGVMVKCCVARRHRPIKSENCLDSNETDSLNGYHAESESENDIV